MKIRLLLSFLLLSAAAFGRQKVQGYCEQGGNTVTTSGYVSTTKVQKSFPGCTVTVYLAGTTTLATIYADNSSTPKANPFTASASDGLYFFYADNARYDVRLSGGGIPTPFTIGDILLADPSGFTATVSTFNGRTGNVSPATDDYNFNQVAGTVNVGTQVGAGDKQGTDAKLLTAGTVSGEGNPLCVSGNGGATTSGCTSALPTPTAQLQQLRVKPNTGNNTTLEFAASASVNSVDFIFPAQSPGGSLIVGNNLVTLAPVPVGVNWNDVYHRLYVSGGTGTAEACLIVAAGPGTATSGAASGTLTLNCANTHSGAWTIQSATAGIQEAINATPWEPGGEIRIPPSPVGTFWDVYAGITVTNNYVQIVGSGKSSIVRFLPTSGAVFTFAAGGLASFHGIRNQLKDVTIEGPATNTVVGVSIYGQTEARISGVYINSVDVGIKVDGITSIVWIDQTLISTLMPTTGIGIYQTGGASADLYVTNSVILGTYASQPAAGIKLSATSGTKITGNSIYATGTALLINPGNGEEVWAVDSSFNWYDTSSANAVTIAPTGTGVVKRVVSVGDWFATAALNGIEFGATGTIDGVVISDARIYNNGRHGVLYNGGTNVEFRGLTVSGNSQSSPGNYHGMAFAAGTGGFRVSGGLYGPSSGWAASEGYGILIATGASDDYSIHGATFINELSGKLSDGGTGMRKVIANNLGVSDIFVIKASATSVSLVGVSNDCIYITGTTTITTITGGWVGRKIRLIKTDAGSVTVGGGGNIPGTHTLAQYGALDLVFDGSNWL
jgi:hypothetical protein